MLTGNECYIINIVCVILYHGRSCRKRENKLRLKSLDSIRYLYLHDALPPVFPVEIRKYQTSGKSILNQFQQNKTNGQLIMIFWHKRSRHDKNICTSHWQVSESKLPLMTTDEILQNVSN